MELYTPPPGSTWAEVPKGSFVEMRAVERMIVNVAMRSYGWGLLSGLALGALVVSMALWVT